MTHSHPGDDSNVSTCPWFSDAVVDLEEDGRVVVVPEVAIEGRQLMAKERAELDAMHAQQHDGTAGDDGDFTVLQGGGRPLSIFVKEVFEDDWLEFLGAGGRKPRDVAQKDRVADRVWNYPPNRQLIVLYKVKQRIVQHTLNLTHMTPKDDPTKSLVHRSL